MGRGVLGDPDRQVEPVAGDETAGGRDYDPEFRLADRHRRKQHPQRIVLVEMIEPRALVAADEADLGDAVNTCSGAQPQYPSAMPSLRGSEPPIKTPRA